MEYRRLGKSGLKVSALSLGSWLTFGKQIDLATSESLMRYAYDQGINFFDNAEIYARGESEIVMGRILKRTKWQRSSYLVSSKVYFGDGGKLPNQTGLSRKHIMEACNAALRRLQVEYLDLYFCHRADKEVPMEEIVWTMNHLIAQGKILYWGTSEWTVEEIKEAHTVAKEMKLIGPVMEQPQYNMFTRSKVEQEFASLYQNEGLGTTIWSPLLSGVLTNKYLGKFPKGTRLGVEGLEWLRERSITPERLEIVRALNEIAIKMDTSLPRLAIAWCLKNPNVSTVILGASKLKQLKENIKSLETMELLDESTMATIAKMLEGHYE